MKLKALAIDLAKDFFQLYGVDETSTVVLDKKVGRGRFAKIIKNLTPTTIYMEACGGAHHWARLFRAYGHTVRLIAPHHVKPYVGHQKNDRNDARAILEACQRPESVFVGVKALWQQDLQTLHKLRDLKLKQQVATINHIRGLMMEYGVVLPKGHTKFKQLIPLLLEDAENTLTAVVRECCSGMYQSYLVLSEEILSLEKQLTEISKGYEFTKKAQEEIRGVGPLITTRFLASIGDVTHFSNGRQVSAWLGLVPRQRSTGGRTKLGRITKHGDSDLRKIIIQGARSAVTWARIKDYGDEDTKKIRRLEAEKGFNVAAVATANRNVRRMYGILRKYGNKACAR